MIKPCHFFRSCKSGMHPKMPEGRESDLWGCPPVSGWSTSAYNLSTDWSDHSFTPSTRNNQSGVHGKKRTPEDDPGLCNPFRKSIKLSAYRVRSSAEWSDGRVTRRILSQKITIRHKPTRFISISPKVK